MEPLLLIPALQIEEKGGRGRNYGGRIKSFFERGTEKCSNLLTVNKCLASITIPVLAYKDLHNAD
jgi:hypothetical protein